MAVSTVKNNNNFKEDMIMMNSIFVPENSNISKVVSSGFGGLPMTQAEEIRNLTQLVKGGKGLVMGPGGVIKPKEDPSIKPEDGNYTEIAPGTFAAGYPEQWYEANKLVH